MQPLWSPYYTISLTHMEYSPGTFLPHLYPNALSHCPLSRLPLGFTVYPYSGARVAIDCIEYDVTVQIFALQHGLCARVRVSVKHVP